jgi:hypothetical protein
LKVLFGAAEVVVAVGVDFDAGAADGFTADVTTGLVAGVVVEVSVEVGVVGGFPTFLSLSLSLPNLPGSNGVLVLVGVDVEVGFAGSLVAGVVGFCCLDD